MALLIIRAVTLVVLVHLAATTYLICIYPCLSLFREIKPYCGVDEGNGVVKVFRNPCLIERSNYCKGTNFVPMYLNECFALHPEAINDYIPGLYRLH